MKIYLLSYSTFEYRISQIILNITGIIFGCNKIRFKTEKDLMHTDFYNENEHILREKRGAGFWVWKYFFINELLKEIKDNDVIVYCDSGIVFRRSIKTAIKILNNETKGVLLFHNSYNNRQWTKRDVYIALKCDDESYYNSPLIFGGLQFFKKNNFSTSFVETVLENSVKDNIITDKPNVLGKPNLPEFIENRHDQSVTSLVAHKHNICLYPDPSQFRTKNVKYCFPSEYSVDENLYRSIIYVHRFSMKKGYKKFKKIFSNGN